MISLIIFYYVGKSFYELAEKNERGNWLYAILGVASYFFTQFLLGIGLGLIWYMNSETEFDPGVGINLLGIVFGAMCTWGLYAWLDYSWSNKPKPQDLLSQDSDLLDDDMILG